MLDINQLYPIFFSKKYKKSLLFGTGGGNDIVSTIIPALQLQEMGIVTDLGGILSPGASHMFGCDFEQEVNINNGNITRYLPMHDKYLPISFIDNNLKRITSNDKNYWGFNKIYDFSTRFGTKRLVKEINKLIRKEEYDVVIGVDVGGDILGRGAQDNTILSPLMDFASLYLLGNLEVDTYLIEFGLLTDGELRVSGIKEIFSELNEKNIILGNSKLELQDESVRKFISAYNDISSVRHGHTAVMTLQTLDSYNLKDIKSKYRFTYRIDKKKWETEFDVLLPSEYHGKIWLLDAKKLFQLRKHTSFEYSNCLEQFLKLKKLCPSWKTELDLLYLWSDNNWQTPERNGQSLFLLTPSTKTHECKRNEILSLYKEILTDYILILKTDLDSIEIKNKNMWEISEDFVIVSSKYNSTDFQKIYL